MLVEVAIADAFGCGFEFRPQEEVKAFNNLLLGYRPDHPETGVKSGHYSDDTHMTIALVELALEGRPWTMLSVANAFVKNYKRDPRPWGYSKRMRDALEGSRHGTEFLQHVDRCSGASGAAMRAMPCALGAYSRAGMQWRADVQAEVTHATVEGRTSAIAAATLGYEFRHGPFNFNIFANAFNMFDFDWKKDWVGRVPCSGLAVVHAAVTAINTGWFRGGFEGSYSMAKTLKNCVAFGGDTDTVAAVAIGALSLGGSEVTRDLPPILYEKLENGPFGLHYLEDLDRQIKKAFPDAR